MGHQKRGAEGSYLGGIEGLLESYRSVFPRLLVNGVQQSRSDGKILRADLDKVNKTLSSLVVLLIETSPEFVVGFEKLRGLKPGTIESLVRSGMTGEQLLRQIGLLA